MKGIKQGTGMWNLALWWRVRILRRLSSNTQQCVDAILTFSNMRLFAHLFYLNIIPSPLSLYATLNLANRKNFREVYSVLLTKETEVELQTFWNVFQWWLWIENSQIVWHSRTVELSRSWWPIRSHNFGFPSSTQFYFPSRSFIRFIEKILLESAISVLNLLYLSNGYSISSQRLDGKL